MAALQQAQQVAPILAGALALLVIVAAAAFAVHYYLLDADVPSTLAAWRTPHDAFAKKVIVITGASSGIGEALAYECAGRQAIVVVCARRIDRLLDVAEKCRRLGATDALVVRLDIEKFDTHAAVVGLITSKFGHIDYFVNNAGRSQRALLEETPLQVDMDLMNINLFGTISITKAVLPGMLARGSGHFVNTSSVAGKLGSPCSASYAATKHAMQGFFDTLRMECGSRGISVTNVCPGPVRSEITMHAMTAQVGVEHGKPTEETAVRMTAERCAALMAGAMHARLPEIWVAPQPILLYTYMAQYAPSLYHAMGPRAGAARVAAFRKGNTGYDSITSNPFATIFSKPVAVPAASTATAAVSAPLAAQAATESAAPPSSGSRKAARKQA